jgi:hypothetical protein
MVFIDTTTELRGDCPRWIVDVLDAVSMAGNQTRTALVNQVLEKWAREKVHEASMVSRMVRSNPQRADDSGRGAE